MMKLASNVGAAQDATTGFAEINTVGEGRHVSLASSNISSMVDGTRVANALMSAVSELISAVKIQADGVTALATEIEGRDSRDAEGWGDK
jgi:hypothetical protein